MTTNTSTASRKLALDLLLDAPSAPFSWGSDLTIDHLVVEALAESIDKGLSGAALKARAEKYAREEAAEIAERAEVEREADERIRALDLVTDEQISQLRREAAEAGDLVQVAICDVALGIYDEQKVWVDKAAARRVRGMTADQAREICAKVIADAAAQAEGGAL